ncbi:MAG: hypothetical protein KDA88_01700 [Planctomycetaceae bacterium]|nr:hypothetical protein [Planctomycetaceae bacterium]
MPTLPPQSVEVRPVWLETESVVPQGPEGQQMRAEIVNVSQHWSQQSMSVLASEEVDLLDQLNNYRHVPFARAGKRRVRYIGIRPLQPRQIDIDLDEGDE